MMPARRGWVGWTVMWRAVRMAGGVLALSGTSALAHPHVFMDSALRLIRDDAGRVTTLEVVWTYDAFYSLSLIADMGLDADGDGEMSDEDMAALQEVDRHWQPGFAGDTYVSAAGQEVGLSPPRDHMVTYVDGRIVSRFLRDLAMPVGGDFTVRNFDPGYYIEYTIRGFDAAGCASTLDAPDLSAADRALQAELAKLPADQDAEAEFPAVGALFAQVVRVTCDPV